VQKEYQQCLHALFVTNPLDDLCRIQTTKDTLVEGSCSWIFGSLTYTNWLNSELSWTLWIHGDPGKGKTSMTIALVAELSSRVEHSSGPNSILAYFFCDKRTTGRTVLSLFFEVCYIKSCASSLVLYTTLRVSTTNKNHSFLNQETPYRRYGG